MLLPITPIGPPNKQTKPSLPLAADTGSTGHYIPCDTIAIDNELIINIKPAVTPIQVSMPDEAIIQSTHTCNLDIPNLPTEATEGHLFPEMGPVALLSIGKLCDAGCEAIFREHECTITFMGDTILTGTRNQQTDKLWHIDQQQQKPTATQPHKQLANIATTTSSAKPADLVAFAHAALFSPTIAALRKALKNKHIINFPGLSLTTLNKYPPHSIATAKGHMNQQRQGIQSTKQEQKPLPLLPDNEATADNEDMSPPQDPDNLITHACYAAIFETTGKTFSDQTGRFFIPSSTGNNYVFIMYDYDSNSIHAEAMPNRSAKAHVQAYTTVHNRLVKAGLRPQLHMLDNECSDLLREYITNQGTKLQTTPVGIHRRNAAERAIQTFKNHFIAGLATTDPNFPLHLWDRLLPQAVISINILRTSRINPNLSAYAQVFGQFDFMATPLAPPGIHVLVHEKPRDRKTWAPKGKDGWYLGPAMDSYRCFRTWIWETQRERKADTLTWFPMHLQMPIATATDLAIAGITDIVNSLNNPTLPNSIPLDDTELQTLKNLSEIFTRRDPCQDNQQPPQSDGPQSSPSKPHPSQRLRVIPTEPQRKQPARKARTNKHYAKAAKTHATYEATPETLQWLNDHFEIDIEGMIMKALNPDTKELADYKELRQSSDGTYWQNSCSDEIGRLAQGRLPTMPTGTDTMRFIPRSAIPEGRAVTYLRIVCDDRPQKADPRRVRFTVGGDRVDYPFDVSTKTAALVTVKILLNSVISTNGARFMTIDIKDFYLNTPMTRFEYMRIPTDVIPDDIMNQYNLQALEHNGYVYVEIRKGMYGLPQAGRIANDQLVPYLAQHGYIQSKHTHGLFTHNSRPIAFSLIVDDFGVKYTGKEHAQHLIDVLSAKYRITKDWTGSLYCGIRLAWDYKAGTVTLDMPNYVNKALQRFKHPQPDRPEHAPHKSVRPQYGATIQYTENPETSQPLDKDGIKTIREIVGTLLYYARAIDNTMLMALNDIAAAQANGTQHTLDACTKLLNYAATHPDAAITYHKSKMILHTHSDASYLSAPKARSRAGGYHYLGNGNIDNPTINGPIHVVATIMKNVLSSAAEAEVGAAFVNAQDACPIRQTLTDLGHEQPATPLQTDNQVAEGILQGTVKQKRSKAIDMRFYWLRDRVEQGQFNIYWRPGATNLADYVSKHHPANHHRSVRSIYLAPPKQPEV